MTVSIELLANAVKSLGDLETAVETLALTVLSNFFPWLHSSEVRVFLRLLGPGGGKGWEGRGGGFEWRIPLHLHNSATIKAMTRFSLRFDCDLIGKIGGKIAWRNARVNGFLNVQIYIV